MTTANETQVAGDHYKGKAIQPWDYIAANGLDYFSGNIVKYVSRFREKRGVEDLRKARHYLDKLISDRHRPKRPARPVRSSSVTVWRRQPCTAKARAKLVSTGSEA